MASVPSEADALAGLEEGDVGSDCVDNAGNLVTGDARELDSGPLAFLRQRVGVADAAGVNADADVAGVRVGEFALLRVGTLAAGGGHLHGTAFD